MMLKNIIAHQGYTDTFKLYLLPTSSINIAGHHCCHLLPVPFNSPDYQNMLSRIVLLASVIYEYSSVLLTAANNTIQLQYVAMVKQEYPNILYTINTLICSYCCFYLFILTEKSKTAKSNHALFQKSDRYFKG